MKLMILLLALVSILGGCSSLSKEECLQKNWFKLGRADAMKGVSKPKTSEYRQSCAKHGLQIKSMKYLKGFEYGLKKYCTYKNGKQRGEEGEERHHLCEEASSKFKRGYKVGFREFKRQESIKELKKKLIEDNGGQECRFNSDCVTTDRCVFKKCEQSGNKCSFDSDCETQGKCESVSAWADFNDHISVQVCKKPQL